MEQWKSDKVKKISSEVNELHPILREIFTADSSIANFEHTHGPTEMGADFVLARIDPTLGDESYVGVIVKCGNIKQDYTDIKRQIDECSVERYFSGAKKKIYISEIWIVCNGSISNGAEKKIHEDYRSKNIKFIDIDRLCKLIEKHTPHYWNEVSHEMGRYLRETMSEIITTNSSSIIGIQGGLVDIESELYEVRKINKNKAFTYNKSLRTTIEKAVADNRLIIIEGGMGAGKSTMFRKYAKKLCDPTIFQQQRIVPKIVHFKAISESPMTMLNEQIQHLKQIASSANPKKYLIFVDGLDEVIENSEKTIVEKVESIFKSSQTYNDIIIVLGSRPTWTIDEGNQLLKFGVRYKILPLTLDQIYNVVQKNCTTLRISDKLRGDLAKSSLLKALPRTPLSAILLAKVLSANPKEIPQTLPELYSKYVELSLGRWDITKGLMTEREYPVIVSVLSQVAKFMLENQIQSLGIDEVLSMFNDYTKTREGLPSSEHLFENLSLRSELININHESKIFSFRHKSFAEYLFALYQKEQHGKSAPLSNPFHGYWLGVEYFYLGLIQDAGERIDRLSAIQLPTDRERLLRLLHFGNLMLAAYQTEYTHIEKALFYVFIEMSNYFIRVKNGEEESIITCIPELQFFAIIYFQLKESFEYDYFKKALESAQLFVQCDTNLTDEQRIVASFLIDSVRASLKENNIFEFISNQKLALIPWVVKLGIKHVVEDEKIDLSGVKALVKRINKSKNNNPNLNKYLLSLYNDPMRDRFRKN